MDKPKKLPSSLREKKRYIVYRVFSSEKILFSDLSNALWESIAETLGSVNLSKAKVWIMKDTYDEEKAAGIIRCSHNFVEHVRSGITLVQRVGDSQVVVNVIGVSGTIKGAKNKFMSKDFL